MSETRRSKKHRALGESLSRKADAIAYDEEKVDVSDPKNREFITAMIEPKLVAPKTKARG